MSLDQAEQPDEGEAVDAGRDRERGRLEPLGGAEVRPLRDRAVAATSVIPAGGLVARGPRLHRGRQGLRDLLPGDGGDPAAELKRPRRLAHDQPARPAVLLEKHLDVARVALGRALAELDLDRQVAPSVFNDPVDLRAVGVAPEPEARVRGVETASLPRGSSRDAHVEDQVAARPGQLLARCASGDRFHPLRDQAVAEDVVIGLNGDRRDPGVLGDARVVRDAPGLARRQFGEPAEGADVADQRLLAHLFLETGLAVRPEVDLPARRVPGRANRRQGAVDQGLVQRSWHRFLDRERIQAERHDAAGQQVEVARAPQLPGRRTGGHELGAAAIDHVLSDVHQRRHSLHLVDGHQRNRATVRGRGQRANLSGGRRRIPLVPLPGGRRRQGDRQVGADAAAW